MSTMTYLNITVRRVDRGALCSADLEQFADFFEKEVLGGHSKQYPHVATDWKSMYAYCEWCGGSFGPEVLTPFAEAHPEYQIETIAEYSDCDERERILHQGHELECIQEERYFPDPQIIKWNHGE